MSVMGVYFLSIFLGAGGAFAASQFADRLGLIDCPNERSSHCTPTPKGGGIGIFAALLLSATTAGLPMTFWLPIFAISVLGFWGDRKNLSPKLRLYSQLFLIALLVIGTGPSPSNPFWFFLWVLFWTVFIVGTANFYNFMDGINGIAAITGVVGFGLLAAYIYMQDGQSLLFTIAICISLACLGFLPLNFPKAKVFMGDIGSILLGSVFVSLIFLTSKTFLDYLCMASFLFPFYADALTTMVVRLIDGESLIQPHRRHIYQILANEKGIEHWKISMGFGLLQLVVGTSVILVKPYGILAVLLLLIICFIIFIAVSFYLRLFLEKSPRHGSKFEAKKSQVHRKNSSLSSLPRVQGEPGQNGRSRQ
jgi:UDP-N-acetylmuramyl pentapeptide phosphotransferase/UDP-N-acetylglucosamine-1-phosphate transferase